MGAIHEKTIVHEVERLLRNGGERALARGKIGIREIEDAVNTREELAIDKTVNGAFGDEIVAEERDWFAAGLGGEFAGGVEE